MAPMRPAMRARRTGRLLLALVFSMEASIDETTGEGHTFEKDESDGEAAGLGSLHLFVDGWH